MIRILVADKLAGQALDWLGGQADVTCDVRLGMSPDKLAEAVGAYDGMIIRSGVRVDEACLAKAGRLRAIARAGVGVDNVDLKAASAAGVLVMNTPEANTVSTAEHTMALLFAAMRRIPEAHAHVTGGGWRRSSFVGRQLAGKTLGIVGLGRVGRAVAIRALACDMRVVGFDPFIGTDSVLEGRVRVIPSLGEMLSACDCVTLHAKLTEQTRHLIGWEELGLLKASAVVVNCARGELVDEVALAEALNEGRIGGAAIDVFSSEPPEGNPLLGAKNVVLTPHLGASTAEAQLAVSLDAADALVGYLKRGEIRGAVNLVGLPSDLTDVDRAYFDLCGRLGRIASAWCGQGVDRIRVTTRGGRLERLSVALSRQAAAEVLSAFTDGRVNLVNVETSARHRGIEVESACAGSSDDRMEIVELEVETSDGAHRIEGAVYADNGPRLLSVDGYRMEMMPEKTLVMIFNDDRPGVVGQIGTVFGESGLNIADMALSRRGKRALAVLKLDEVPGAAVMDRLDGTEAIVSVRSVTLDPVGGVGAS